MGADASNESVEVAITVAFSEAKLLNDRLALLSRT